MANLLILENIIDVMINKKEWRNKIMKTKLSLGEKLNNLRKEKKFTIEYVAEETKMSSSTINNYESCVNNDKNISIINLAELAKFYEVSVDWLLGLSVSKMNLNTDIIDLGLTDTAIEALKSKKFNHRLLSEIIEHSMFEDIMTNIEICVDGKMSSVFTTLNEILKLNKDGFEGMSNYSNFDKILEKVNIQDDRYFHSMIFDELREVIDDITKAHRENKKDQTVAKENNEAYNAIVSYVMTCMAKFYFKDSYDSMDITSNNNGEPSKPNKPSSDKNENQQTKK